MTMKTISFLSLLFVFTVKAYAYKMNHITKWGYQLTDYSYFDLQKIKRSSNTLWVIDYSESGEDKDRFTPKDLADFKNKNNIIISYFCLGEAEKTRYYFKDITRDIFITRNDINLGLPYNKDYRNYVMINDRSGRPYEILTRANDEYVDNFPIKYWNTQWNQMLSETTAQFGKSYLARIMDSNFDGIYLDTVDAFEYYDYPQVIEYAEKMANLVIKLGRLGRQRNPNFIIFMQNGMWIYELLEDKPSLRRELFSYIDAFGIEDLFHPGEGNDNKYDFSKYGEYDFIKDIRDEYPRTKFFTVDYIPGLKSKAKKKYFKKAMAKGFIPLIAERKLAGELILNSL